MNGQWIGRYTGTNNGDMILNVDDRGSRFRGVGYFTDDQRALPALGAGFWTNNKENEFEFTTEDLWPINPKTGYGGSWDEMPDTQGSGVKRFYDSTVAIPKRIKISGRWDQRSLRFTWTTDVGSSGECELPRSSANTPSELQPAQMGWSGFKEYVARLAGTRHLFRGQEKPWRLRTAFHRTGRADLIRFVREDIQALHRHLSARTRHIFNLESGHENGAFFNLVQHHGYPTPLLDWTYSPYVAAFFAYRNVSRSDVEKEPNSRVRVFVLDERWRTDVNQVIAVDRSFLHFSTIEFIAIDNERMVPQQSVSSVTNVDDIETYIQHKQIMLGKGYPYLKAIDLPASERAEVFRELGYMGITAGSLFPGFDGACEELKERNFQW